MLTHTLRAHTTLSFSQSFKALKTQLGMWWLRVKPGPSQIPKPHIYFPYLWLPIVWLGEGN